MFWFGRIALAERWPAVSDELVEEATDSLLLRACVRSVTGSEGSVFLDPESAGRHAGVFEGEHSRLNVNPVTFADLAGPVDWVDRPLEEPNSPWMRCEVKARDGGATLALAYYATGCCYSRRELARALEISFDSMRPRRGKASVLRTGRLPPPVFRPPRGTDRSTPMGIFRCDKPGCPSRGQEVLVRMSNFIDARLQHGRATGVIAYPCPSCPGSWEQRWVLSWVREQPLGEPIGFDRVVDFAMPPMSRRRRATADAMWVVIGTHRQVRWGSVWDATTVAGIPDAVIRFTRDPRLHTLADAFRSQSDAAGAMSAYLLTQDNVRAFVDYCRSLPAERRKGMARGFALAFSPRMMKGYRVKPDDRQLQDDHHPYISLEPESFYDWLAYLGVLDHPGRFLDIGSGIGEKPFLAYAIGKFSQCDGLEYDPRTTAVADYLMATLAPQTPYPIRTIEGDALEFDSYGDYDVIYMYRPFNNRLMMGRLVRRVAQQMKEGALLFDPLGNSLCLKKTGPGEFAEAEHGADGLAAWTRRTTVDDCLERHGFV